MRKAVYLVGLVLCLVLSLSLSEAHAGGWQKVDCAGSRLVTSGSYTNVECYYSTTTGSDYGGQYDFYGMVIDQSDWYLNMALRMAGFHGHIFLESYPDMKSFALDYFGWLKGKTTDWSEAQQGDGLHYISFTYKSYPCFAFERGQQPRGRGYKYAFTGLVCRPDGGELSFEDFKAIALSFTNK